MKITSIQNPKIKQIQKLLAKSSERKKQQLFVVEGVQENGFALTNAFVVVVYYIQPDIFTGNFPKEKTTYEVSAQVYDKIAYRSTTEGIIGVYKTKQHHIIPSEKSTVLVLEAIEKPGNLGAILRTANAFGIDALLISEALVDIYNPNVIRSSVGCVFTIPIIVGSNTEVYSLLKENNYSIYGTFMHEKAIELPQLQTHEKKAILFGTEHSGISDFWKDKVTENFLIPMKGSVDSLNLSNAVAISLYAMS